MLQLTSIETAEDNEPIESCFQTTHGQDKGDFIWQVSLAVCELDQLLFSIFRFQTFETRQ